MDKQPSDSSTLPVKQAHKSRGSLTIALILLCVLFTAAVVGVYFWQHHKVTTLSSQLATQSTNLSSLQVQVSNLKKGSQTNLTFSVNHASRFDVFGAGTTDDISVNVTIKN